MNVLFVCLSNICRSPMAEGILKKMYSEMNITGKVESAGFESYHINESPDPKAIEAALRKSVDISTCKSRLFTVEDFDSFDRIYVMDTQNMHDVKDTARDEEDMKKVDYLLNVLYPGLNRTVPNPYHSGTEDCDKVFVILYEACEKIVQMATKN